ncbi:MAG: hypothetical protein Kow00128_02060 [Deltaproteobacteria bacterium]
MNRITASALAVLGFLVVTALTAADGMAAVSVLPAQTAVSPGQATRITVQYRFTGVKTPDGAPYTGNDNSSSGVFLAEGAGAPLTLGTVPTAVTARLVNGAGVVTESLTVPAAVVDSAVRAGFSRFLYERVFTDDFGVQVTADLVIAIAGSEAAGPLRILRTELYFSNRRGEITVRRNERGLRAFADIRYGGTGVLTGFWEVDGRRILDVNRQLTFGTTVTLSTPEIPDLPTFDTGVHIVRLVLTGPAQPEPLPQLLYYVTAAKELRSIRIAVREEGAGAAPGGKHLFSWEKPEGMNLFFLEFSEEAGGKPIFSAFTRQGSYVLPDRGVEGIFVPGRRYFWQVKGYDESDEQVGMSGAAPFRY